jgi:hypothetical protein
MTRKSGSTASSPSTSFDNGPSTARFVCSMCAKVYRSGAGLRYHKRKRHRGVVEPTALHRVKCQELGCTYQMLAISDLRNHLSNHHQKHEYKCTEEKKFTALVDFTEWKSSFETSTGSKYVKNCGAKGKSDNQTTEYYYCNRTGPFGQGLRRNKAQGSLRGGIHCTSSMKVEIQNDEHVTVQYYPAHYGHSNLPASDEPNLSENNLTITGANIHHPVHHHHHQQQQQQQQQETSQHGGDRSSSSSPGSLSTSPSGGSNSNSNHPPLINERQSIPTTTTTTSTNSFFKNMNNNSIQNQMSHCLIISPSFMIEDHPSNHHHTSVLVVQQNLSTSSSNSLLTPPTKKEKCVSDIMHEAFQLLSYWPLDHHHGLITTENEQILSHSRLNMDEHLMF